LNRAWSSGADAGDLDPRPALRAPDPTFRRGEDRFRR
jgi:hypothetical protein